jgi:hypothetical protein
MNDRAIIDCEAIGDRPARRRSLVERNSSSSAAAGGSTQ